MTVTTADQVLMPPAPNVGPKPASSILDVANGVNSIIGAWYGTKTALAVAKGQAKIAEAEARYNVAAAGYGGLPSPNLLLIGGGVLVAIVLLTRGGGGRK